MTSSAQPALLLRLMRPIVGAATALVLVSPPSLELAASASPLDQALAAYRSGDYGVVARTFSQSRNFEPLRLPDRRRLDDWLGTWQRDKAAFMLEMTNAASLNAPAYTMMVLSAGQRYILRRPQPPGSSTAEDEFERLWHKIAFGILQRRQFDLAAEEYFGILRASRSAPSLAVWDERFTLAHAIAREQRCWRERPSVMRAPGLAMNLPSASASPTRNAEGPSKSAIEQPRCLQEAAARFEAASAGELTRDEARVRGAWALVQLGQFQKALRSLEGVAPGEDRELAYWASLLRGRVAVALGRHAEAEGAFRTALAEYPDAQSAAIGLALTLFNLDRAAEADETAIAVRSRSRSVVDPWWTYLNADDRFVERWVVLLRKAAQ